jgi:hypothetical protein
VIGPIIAAHTFFNGANAYSLDTVQYVYLALAVFALLINILVFFAKLPEVRQVVTVDQQEKVSKSGFFKQYHTIFGFRGSSHIPFHNPIPPPSLNLCSGRMVLCRSSGSRGFVCHLLYVITETGRA